MNTPTLPGYLSGKVHTFLFASQIGDRVLAFIERTFFVTLQPSQPEDPDAQLYLQFSRDHDSLLSVIANRIRFGYTPVEVRYQICKHGLHDDMAGEIERVANYIKRNQQR